MRPNEELVEKAAITAADALVAAGKLNPQQVREYHDTVIDESAIKGHCRIERVDGETWELSKIGVGRRALVPASEAKDPGVRRGVTTSKLSLTPKKVMLPYEIGDEFRRVNVEGERVEQRIVRMFATKFANDTEELYIQGNLLGPAQLESDLLEGGDNARYIRDGLLALHDGFLRLARGGAISNAANANIGLGVFGAALRAMPTRFRRDPGKLRFFCGPNTAQLWQERLSTRGTAMGDAAVTSAAGTLKVFGVPLVPLPLLPDAPLIVEHLALPDAVAVNLAFAPVANVVVTPANLGNVPTVPYVVGAGNDYTVDLAAGTITNLAGGAIANNATVKITYTAGPQMILTHEKNFIIGLGHDVRIEKARDIYRQMNQYAVSMSVGVAIEDVEAAVLVSNIGSGI